MANTSGLWGLKHSAIVLAGAAALALAFTVWDVAQARGSSPSATVSTCTESALNTALTGLESDGGGTVDISCSVTITLTEQIEIPAGVGVIIDGSDAGASGATISGGGTTRLFQVDSGGTLTLNKLTLEDGSVTGSTGASGASGTAGAGGLSGVQGVSGVSDGSGGNGGNGANPTSGGFGDAGTDGQGGAILVESGSSLVVTNSDLTNDVAYGGAGGSGGAGGAGGNGGSGGSGSPGVSGVAGSGGGLGAGGDGGGGGNGANGASGGTGGAGGDSQGGAIYSAGSLTLTGDRFSGDGANGGAGGQGGAGGLAGLAGQGGAGGAGGFATPGDAGGNGGAGGTPGNASGASGQGGAGGTGEGGAVYSLGVLTGTATTFSGNTSAGGSGGQGGYSTATPEVDGSAGGPGGAASGFGNSPGGDGGNGGHSPAVPPTVPDGAAGNGGDGTGGALYLENGGTLSASMTFTGNSADGADGTHGDPGRTGLAGGTGGAGGPGGVGEANDVSGQPSGQGGTGGNGAMGADGGNGGDGGDGGNGGDADAGAVYSDALVCGPAAGYSGNDSTAGLLGPGGAGGGPGSAGALGAFGPGGVGGTVSNGATQGPAGTNGQPGLAGAAGAGDLTGGSDGSAGSSTSPETDFTKGTGSGCDTPLSISTTSVSGATQYASYSQSIAATGGDSPYTFKFSRGSLPSGFSVTPGGLITGTPTQSGTFDFSILAEDSSDPTQEFVEPFALTVTAVTKPVDTSAPSISGTGEAGKALSCAHGVWSGPPSSYTYVWARDGTLIQGATGSSYTVQKLDEGTTLTCTVTASNVLGEGSAVTSKGFNVPVPPVPRCPAATGSLSGSKLGLIRLGMTKKQARHAYTHSSTRGQQYKDFFCLTPYGVRVGYASPKLLRGLPAGERGRYRGRVLWASTDNARYAVGGIRAGATLSAAEKALPHGYYFPVGANYWYLAPAHGATAVLKVRHDLVEEVGIAVKQLTGSHKADRALMTSFG